MKTLFLPLVLFAFYCNIYSQSIDAVSPPQNFNIQTFQNNTQKRATNSMKIGNSDVDINIPTNKTNQTNSYALIIGNEDYSSYQTDLSTEINVDYAMNDAMAFKEYCHKTLGIPERQIKLLVNATYGQMSQGLAWIKNMAKVEGGNAELVFYYSGHGLPDEKTKEGYLIPVDISGNNVQSGLALKKVTKELNQYPTKKITQFLDACFSGGARNEGLVAMKGIKIKPKQELIVGNMVSFASSSGDESSGVFREKQHGYFTYFLLKKLKQKNGNVSYKEMADYLNYQVKKETGLSGKIQSPQVIVSKSISNSWESWRFK
ncbi:MAG: caspase family protein [Flavobacteriales bacterium]|nr:caspase family protein [Flavobacteriales bacterium]